MASWNQFYLAVFHHFSVVLFFLSNVWKLKEKWRVSFQNALNASSTNLFVCKIWPLCCHRKGSCVFSPHFKLPIILKQPASPTDISFWNEALLFIYIQTHFASLHSSFVLFSQIQTVNNHNVLKHFLKRIILEISNLFVYCFVFIWNKV